MAGIIGKLLASAEAPGTLSDGKWKAPSREDAIAYFVRYNETVLQTISAERLLVFEVKEGWAPLCRFLNLPVPDAAFPRENSTEDFQKQYGARRSAP